MMLNTDICLVFDIDRAGNNCCTREGECGDFRGRQCPIYDERNKRREAADAVIDFIGGSMDDTDNTACKSLPKTILSCVINWFIS